jgi:transient receptor potential cation channel subfamily M protein 3
MYLLIANILLINLLIAVFNNIFNETNSISHQIWMFSRFTVVMEYQQKPVIPPPLIAFCHFYSLLKYFFRKAKGLQEVRDNGLKLFLEKDDLERLYDFEEECVEGFFQEQNSILLQSTEERIKNTDERVENMTQKIEDINTKENLQALSIQNMEFRLRKMEESTEQILNHLAVIHRFMSTHINNENIQGSIANLSFPHAITIEPHQALAPRNRTMSENDTSNVNFLAAPSRPKKFNRSLTEVRPDAYIFDEGAHFEVRTVLEENEMMCSNDEINEFILKRNRKLSVQSEEPEYCGSTPTHAPQTSMESAADPNQTQQQHQLQSNVVTTQQQQQHLHQQPSIMRSDSINRRPISCNRQDTNVSTESKDTLTPLEGCEEKTLVGNENINSNNNNNNADDVDKGRFGLRRRNSQLGRRNSESQHYDIHQSQSSLNFATNPLMTKRQFSLTQSEPETDANGATPITKPSIKAGRHLLLQIHAEYTSITDELESMIASPTSSLLDEKPKNINELSNPEFAALMEKQHLKECEDDDYAIMEGLLQTKASFDESDDNLEGGFASDYSRRMLRRETAIELPVTPAKKEKVDNDISNKDVEYQVKNERESSKASSFMRTSSMNQDGKSTTMSYLNPDAAERVCKTSIDSLHKNSSSDTTDYSHTAQHPYHVIKQNSNDTNSSFNIDNSSFTNDLSLDATLESSLNATVIESALHNDEHHRVLPKRASTICSTMDSRPSFLRKQFSIDQSNKRPHSENFESRSTPQQGVVGVQSKISSRLHNMNVLKDSSSTSTDETKDESLRKIIPSISTHLVQDEIAKLSSNIKSSMEEDNVDAHAVSDENLETMC